MKYTEDIINYNRINTLQIKIGDTTIGGNSPIALQSMTSTNTQNIEQSVEQVIKIIEQNADYVRLTTPSIKDVEALEQIKNRIRQQGFPNPLIADIHFNNKIAEAAAKIVEKIRVNPGNFVSNTISYEQQMTQAEEKLIALIKICKQHNTAIRIGTNHGSLSARIVEKYGDTPLGMVEQTLEYLRICKQQNFNNIVVSLKSSNTLIMVRACRMLICRMREEDMLFPLHLGVTEAGEGEDARIKSAIGIGALLIDGIGDTIRVSLTESPEKEIPVAKAIVRHATERKNQRILPKKDIFFDSFNQNLRQTETYFNIGHSKPPIVIADISNNYTVNPKKADFIYLGARKDLENYNNQNIIIDYLTWNLLADTQNCFPIFTIDEFFYAKKKSNILNFITLNYADITKDYFQAIVNQENNVLVLEILNDNYIGEMRSILYFLKQINNNCPLIFKQKYTDSNLTDMQIKASIDLSVFLIDGFVNGIFISNNILDSNEIVNTSFYILQASKLRITKTEYISCPSCGRTLYDIQHAAKEIRKHTEHLTGLKIAIMGCIVNGPGEMADAHYGYVGAGEGKINLYKQKEVIKKNIPEKDALNELINIIKENGDWK